MRIQDMKVLSTMVLVKQVHAQFFPGTHIHVVGENAIDATSDLAQGLNYDVMPDLVNTQAIYARVLIQALVHPGKHWKNKGNSLYAKTEGNTSPKPF